MIVTTLIKEQQYLNSVLLSMQGTKNKLNLFKTNQFCLPANVCQDLKGTGIVEG